MFNQSISIIRRKFLWKISISLWFSNPQTFAPYRRIGTTHTSNKLHSISTGRRKILDFSRRANMAFLACVTCLSIAFLKDPLKLNVTHIYIYIYIYNHPWPQFLLHPRKIWEIFWLFLLRKSQSLFWIYLFSKTIFGSRNWGHLMLVGGLPQFLLNYRIICIQ